MAAGFESLACSGPGALVDIDEVAAHWPARSEESGGNGYSRQSSKEPSESKSPSSPRLASSHAIWYANRLRQEHATQVRDIYKALKVVLPKIQQFRNSPDMANDVNLKMCFMSACPVIEHLCCCLKSEITVGSDAEAGSPRRFSSEGSIYDTVFSGPATPSESEGQENIVNGIDGHDAGGQISKGSHGKVPVKRLSITSNGLPDCGSRRKSFTVVAHDVSSVPVAKIFGAGGEAVTSYNRFYVHPEKSFKLFWDFFAMLLILTLMVVIPLELAFFWKDPPPLGLDVLSVFVDIFFGLDIVLNFITAYYEGHGVASRLVTDLRGIAKHYAKGWLSLDLLASFPYMYVVTLLNSGDAEESSGAEAVGMLRVMRIAKVARIMKVLRMLKLGGLMQSMEEKLVAAQSMTVAFQLMKMTVVMLIMCHNVACLWYAIAALNEGAAHTWLKESGLHDRDGFSQYIAAFYFAITTGTTVGYGDITPQNTGEQACTAVLLILSVGQITHFLGRVSVMVTSLRHNENVMAQAKRDALLFMTQRQVPKELQFKVLRYIEHTSETQALTHMDNALMNSISKSLQSELALAITGNVLRQFPLFAEFADGFLSDLCHKGKTHRAGEGEIVVAEEQPAHEMFWVVRGEVAVMRKGRHLSTLRSKDWFGELSLFFPGVVRNATMRCETHSEFFVLHHDVFQSALRDFPAVKKQYEKLVKELKDGNVKGLKLKCAMCGAKEHLTRDCPANSTKRM